MNVEKNKILASFLGRSGKTNKSLYAFKNLEYNGQIWFNETELRFHTDWNWLMQVVEKIESLKHCQIDISLNWCRIGYKDTLFNYDSRNYFKGLTKIDAVYNACVEFIKWYNENKLLK